MKKKVAAGAVLAICLSVLIYTTIAYFNTADTARNVITSGNIKIELQETALVNDTEIPFKESQDVYNVMPGQEVSKIVRVENTGSNPAYIRISVDKAIQLAESVQGNPDTDLISIDYDSSWTLKDGYYYYNKPLAAGNTTEPLFRNVTFDSDMGNMYQNSQAVIKVSAQATQVKNNGDNAIDAKGWPADDATSPTNPADGE